MEMSRGNGGKVQYDMEIKCHVHAPATLILRKTTPVQSGHGTEEISLLEVKHWPFSSQTIILLSELP
jgi:hypothetical protein